MTAKMSTAEAIQQLRADPENAELIRDAYLGEDTREAAERFALSAEFGEVRAILGDRLAGVVLDLGAGTGIASFALADSGARVVYALDPDPSPVVGRGAISRLGLDSIVPLEGFGEAIPLASESVDVVYARQVLHHTRDLEAVAREVQRVLRPGGVFLACREHVVADEAALEEFLASHPVHQLAGGEGAYPIDRYLGAMRAGGLRVRKVWRPLDSVINAFPLVRSSEELASLRIELLGPRMGRLGGWTERLPVLGAGIRRRLAPYTGAGAMWSFLTSKP